MNIHSILKRAFLQGYAAGELNVPTMFVCIGFTALIAVFICLVYKLANKNSFFSRSFQFSLFGLAVITSAIILTVQSNVVVSLGMVGALSIVRFRTAIKEPMDLVFLFWSISVGIICGAGFAMIAVICSVILTIGILVFSMAPGGKGTMMLVVNTATYNEKELMSILRSDCRLYKVRARSITESGVNIAVEVRTGNPKQLLSDINEMEDVLSVSLVEHDGEVTA